MVDIDQILKLDLSKKDKIQSRQLGELRTTVLETDEDI
jgi:hypothetical protein